MSTDPGCPFCNAPLRPAEYTPHVGACMRIAISDGYDHPELEGGQLTSGRVAGSDPSPPPDGDLGGGGWIDRWRG